MKHLSNLALLAVVFFTGLTAHAAGTLTLNIEDSLTDEDHESNFWLDYMQGDVSIEEGTYVQINMRTWHADVMNI